MTPRSGRTSREKTRAATKFWGLNHY